jgi:hypothetical protein
MVRFPTLSVGSTSRFRDEQKALATPFIYATPLAVEACAKFVAVIIDNDDDDVDDDHGTIWHMQPHLFFQFQSPDGGCQSLVFGRWLGLPLAGHERLKLPLPTSFPLYQWAEARMGMRARANSPSYSVVDVNRILQAEPIVPIGIAPPPQQGNGRGRGRGRGCGRERGGEIPAHMYAPLLKPGEPLFANNIHTWL